MGLTGRWSRFVGAAWSGGGAAVALVSLAVGLFGWLVPLPASATFSARWIIGVVAPLSILLIATAMGLLAMLAGLEADLRRARGARATLPRVIYATSGGHGLVICLLEASDLFGYGVGVTFYLVNAHGYEDLVGLGRVTNIQDDGRVQVALLHTIGARSEIVQSLCSNDKATTDRLKVKPSVPHELLMGNGA